MECKVIVKRSRQIRFERARQPAIFYNLADDQDMVLRVDPVGKTIPVLAKSARC